MTKVRPGRSSPAAALYLSTETMVASSLKGALSEAFESLGITTLICDGIADSNLFSSQIIIADRLTLRELATLRDRNPGAVVGLADPKLSSPTQITVAKSVDFCLVSSIEHQAEGQRHGVSRSFVFHWGPDLRGVDVDAAESSATSATTLLYHGNRAHLESFAELTLPSIDAVAADYDVVFEAHYRLSRSGRWRPSKKLKNIRIQQVEWSEPSVWHAVKRCDIGIVPNLMPSKNSLRSHFSHSFQNSVVNLNKHAYRNDDWKFRFKITSNPGRIYPFGYFSKPVIADFYPSSRSIIENGVNGFLPLNPTQWARAVERLILEPELRRNMGKLLQRRVDETMNPQTNARIIASNIVGEMNQFAPAQSGDDGAFFDGTGMPELG